MKMTFRWYGEASDSISLDQIRQISGCSGLMGVIDYYAAGEVWKEEAIRNYVGHVHDAGLEVEVIESVNVHEDIKLGLPTREQYIENYKQTIRNLAKYGVKVIVYNFMPVFDWLRTDLAHVNEDGSTSLYYDETELMGMTPLQIVENTSKSSNGFTLPGWEPERLKELEQVLKQYEHVSVSNLKENYRYFLEQIIPVCEECKVKMAVHPDDPAWNIFQLPRIAHSQQDFEDIVSFVDSPSNTICLCTGSLGSNPENDVVSMIRYFGEKNRIGCYHVRNIRHLGVHKFRESAHLSSDGSLDMYEIMKAIYDTGKDTYIRPDHGRMIWGEVGRPGYGLYDRALGIAYLNGLWEAIDKESRR